MRNIALMLERAATLWPRKKALTFQGETISWSELYKRANAVRAMLNAAGIGRGQRVAIYMDHVPAQVVALFGIALNDSVFTVAHRLLKEDQIKHLMSDAEAVAVIGKKTYLAKIKSFCIERRLLTIEMNDWGLLTPNKRIADDNTRAVARAIPTDVANIIYTSGSTGKSKGVVLPHRTLLDGARIVSGYLEITGKDTLLSVLPLNFDYGLNQVLSAVYTGARIVMQSFTVPQQLLDIIEREKVTGLAGVPSMWPNLFNKRMVKSDGKQKFKHLRYITTAGGMHTQDLLKKLSEVFPKTQIIIMYGLTESFRSTYLPFSEIFKRPGSIGKAVPEVEILVLNDKDQPCQPYEKGELIHRGAFVSYGYLNNDELTGQKFMRLETGGSGCLPEMAVRSGDIVSLDKDGYIYYHGRADMQLKSSGYRISPGEVEEVLLMMPEIRHAAAFGIPDDVLGQLVCVAYTTYDGKSLQKASVLKHLQQKLPVYAVPKKIIYLKEMVFTVNGKIDYQALRHLVSE